MRHPKIPVTAALLAAVAISGPVAAQQCRAICAPVVLSQTGAITSNLFNSAPTKSNFLLRMTVVAPTAIPRFSLVGLIQWTPWAHTGSNPFNGQTGEIDANVPAFVYGGIISLIRPQDTGGWLTTNFDVLGLFSPAARSTDKREYTHKFLPELYLDVAPFNRLPASDWLHNVTVYGLVDYVASGLPSGAEQPWPVVWGLQFPIAPLP